MIVLWDSKKYKPELIGADDQDRGSAGVFVDPDELLVVHTKYMMAVMPCELKAVPIGFEGCRISLAAFRFAIDGQMRVNRDYVTVNTYGGTHRSQPIEEPYLDWRSSFRRLDDQSGEVEYWPHRGVRRHCRFNKNTHANEI